MTSILIGIALAAIVWLLGIIVLLLLGKHQLHYRWGTTYYVREDPTRRMLIYIWPVTLVIGILGAIYYTPRLIKALWKRRAKTKEDQ